MNKLKLRVHLGLPPIKPTAIAIALRELSTGSIEVNAVDIDGNIITELLTFASYDGIIRLRPNIPDEYGFTTTVAGRIRVVDG